MDLIKREWIKGCFFVVGLICLAFGIALTIHAGLGVSTWDAVYVGAQKLFGLNLSVWINIESILIIGLAALIAKGKFRFGSMIVSLINGIFIDYFVDALAILRYESVFMQWFLFLAGLCFIGIGIGTYLVAEYATAPVDCLMLAIRGRWNYSIMLSMTICETIGLLLALVLNGPIGVGTLLSAFAFGPLIEFFHHIAQKVYNNLMQVKRSVHNAVDIESDDV